MHTLKATDHVPMKPVVHPWMEQLLIAQEHVIGMVSSHGSPLHLHAEKPFEENMAAFKEVFVKYGMDGKVFYARKANKCLSFAVTSARMGQGVDTASCKEIKQCLDAGINPKDLVFTGAVKERNALELAIAYGVPVVLDNLDEAIFLNELAREEDRYIEVQIRLSGFRIGDQRLPSRFGFVIDTAEEEVLEMLRRCPHLMYTGLHFHLNGYDIVHRGEALGQCITFADRLSNLGLQTKSIDIGGGYLVCYLQDRSAWESFHTALRDAVNGVRNPVTYGNDPLGMMVVDGQLHGEPTVYPYYNETPKDIFLEQIVTHTPMGFEKPNYALLNTRGIRLHIEPGRALLDGAGVTVAKVVFRKNDADGNLLVGLAMNRTNLKSSSADFLLDPIHISRVGPGADDGECFGYLVGGYCLEQEFILKRKIRFKHYPQIGDLMLFVNTAGYMMHFMESEGHLFGTPTNMFYNPDNETFVRDDDTLCLKDIVSIV